VSKTKKETPNGDLKTCFLYNDKKFKGNSIIYFSGSVVDPYPDPNPTFQFVSDPYPDPASDSTVHEFFLIFVK
jgi:hypothetical protein